MKNPSDTTSFAIRFTKRVFGDLRSEYLRHFVAAGLLAILSLLPARLLQYFVTDVSSLTVATFPNFLRNLGFFAVAVALAMGVVSLLRIVAREALMLSLETYLRRSALKRLHFLPVGELQKAQRGDWMTRLSSDLKAAELFLGSTVPDLAFNLLFAGAVTGVLFYYSGAVAWVPLFSGILVGLLAWWLKVKTVPILEQMRTLHSGIFQVLLENLEGWKTIRSYNAQDRELRRVGRKLDIFKEKGQRIAWYIGLASSGSEVLIQLLIGVSLILLGWTVAIGRIPSEAAFSYPFYLGQFFLAVRGIVFGCLGWNRFVPSARRLNQIFSLEISSLPSDGVLLNRLRVNHLPLPLPEVEVTRNRRVSLDLAPGEVKAILGASGCGKSTLLEMLSGLREADVESAVHDSGQLMASVAYVDQKPYVFEGTLRENLLFDRECSDSRILEVLEWVGLRGRFEGAHGVDEPLAEQGKSLSEGEIYRLAIARAVLADRPFVFLDEPFAALDGVAVERVASLIRRLATDTQKGFLLVTHVLPKTLYPDSLYRLTLEGWQEEPQVSVPYLPEKLTLGDRLGMEDLNI